ncbi:aspartic peptidase domain-containing protein [Triangularia verruculosa]|uniref:Aspartic peptidase domain-containing protein n=1 Tax=Triangularia verruculosa TaxID=2587418 RepID=A0AAN6XLD8_9PEZI|nr:aspartic peptidase domain-containing protein [Triangularia verruculosa]
MSLVYLLLQCFLFATATFAHLLVPFTRERILARSLDGKSASVPVAASGHVFVVNVTVGTPAQQLSLLLSPSSPYTWLPDADAAMPCKQGYDPLSGGFYPSDDLSGSACRWGAFSKPKSSTAQKQEGLFVDFSVAYSDTMIVQGYNITDTLKLGDIELDAFPMGLVTESRTNQWIGMLGLGNDATTTYPRRSNKYRPNFIDQLVSSGKIITQAYSIWLNNAEGKSGSLLLGAIDKSRYEGELIRLHSVEPYDVFPSAFAVSLASVSIDGDATASKTGFTYDGPSLPASLSPAELYSYLPAELADDIIAASGAIWNTTIGRATIPCDAGSKNPQTSLRFQLEGPEGPVLNVRLADLVIPQEVTNWEIAYDTLPKSLNRNTCLFGIQKSNSPQHNIGSSLLRRTYMVFDAANKDVALASIKAGSSSTKSVIVPFEKTSARIPSSRLYCAPGSECVSESSSSSDSAGDVDTAADDAEPNSDWKKIVIGVVVPLGILAIALPIIYVVLMRRRRQAKARDEMAARQREADHTDGEDSFREDEYGVKVTVSVSSKVSVAKAPPSPQFFLGVPAGFPKISEDRQSQYSGDALLGPDSRSGSRTGSRSGSENSGVDGKEGSK